MQKSVLSSRAIWISSLFLLGLPALAQESQLEGRVTDASQSIVTQAVITVTRTDSGLQREVLSNDQGLYTVPLLPPGQYQIAVNKLGFKPLTRTGIVLETGTTTTVDLQLEVGSRNESVTVEAAAPLLQPETSSVAHVVDGQSIQDLPLVDRRASQLIGLNGFVVQNGAGLGATFGIAGGRANNAMYTLDGESTQNLPNIGVATLVYDPPVESLQEFNVEMSNYAAELGRTGGGVIQMTTKSGTNDWHGSAYEFFRNNILDARTFFSATNPILRYNLFGASLGGPIKKNKTFFFYNYEGLREITYVATILGVPTLAEDAGNFSADKTVVKDPTTKAPFPGNIIPANLLDPVGAKLAALFPAPNVPGQPSGHNNFLANQANGTIGNNHIARIDHMFREKDRIVGRFVGYTTPTYTGAIFGVAAADPAAVAAHTSYYNVTGTWYHDFSPTVLNEFRTGFDLRSSHTYSSGAGSDLNQTIGLTGADSAFAPNVIVPGYAQMGTTTQQRFQVPTLAIPVVDHIAVIRGAHQFKFGAEYRYASDVDDWYGIAGGQLSFNTTATGNSLAALELGWVDSAQIVNALPLKPRGDNYSLYAQDDWKVTPNLTLNLSEGHRNVVFAQRGVRPLPRLPITAENYTGHAPDTQMFYAYLKQFGGVVASHTSGTDMGTDWRDNDPDSEPVVEIYQGMRQNYEMPDAPRSNNAQDSIGGWRPKGFINLALERGYRFGFEASSDHVSTHMSYSVVLVTGDTREAILDGLRKRHVYAATDNILADVRSGPHLMGDAFSSSEPPEIKVKLLGTAPFAKVSVVKDNKYVYTTEPGAKDVDFRWRDNTAEAGKTSYYYVRGEQQDGELVWASPFWITYTGK